MKLSIIIPTWNTAKVTFRCVQTIKKYLKKIDYEIIVIDNGSSDNTVDLFKKLKDVKLIENKENLGFSKANNIASKQATGNYLLFLNSDMELIDNSLEKMFLYISKDDSIGAIGPQFLNPDLSPQASVFPEQTPFNAFKEFWLHIPAYSKFLPPTNKISNVWSISGGALLIKKTFFEKIGKWNEKYFFYFEDLDLCRAVHKNGKKIVYFPMCKIVHFHGLSGKNIKSSENQWRRLIPGSIKYHGFIKHYLIFLIIWSSQKWQKIKNTFCF